MTTKNANTTAPLNAQAVRQIENSSFGSGMYRGLKIAKAAEATVAAGLGWPTETVNRVDQIAQALARVVVLDADRPALTLDDLLADDATERTRAAISIDEGGTRRATKAQQELSAAAIVGLNSAVQAVAPAMLDTVADWLIEHQDERHLARAARDLPRHMASRVTAWNSAVTAHAELLRIADPMGMDDCERNEAMHRLYSWTPAQLLAFHAEHDLLSEVKTSTPNWWDWPGLHEVELNPARSVDELARRTRQGNDAAEAYNADRANGRTKRTPW